MNWEEDLNLWYKGLRPFAILPCSATPVCPYFGRLGFWPSLYLIYLFSLIRGGACFKYGPLFSDPFVLGKVALQIETDLDCSGLNSDHVGL